MAVLKIRAQESLEVEGVRLFLLDRSVRAESEDDIFVVTNMVVEKVSRYGLMPSDARQFFMQKGEIVALMDDLWNEGYRPSHFKGDNSGEIAAYKAHISDLRYMVNTLLRPGLTIKEKSPTASHE